MSGIMHKNSILIVEDDNANIIALSHILGEEYTIYVAKNGHDAIETAKEYSPDLILLDILMPEMDGYEVFSQLKNTAETRSIPVIFVTGLVEEENEEKGMALGAADYIMKPFSEEIVKLRVLNQMKILDRIKMIKQSSIVENSPHFIISLSYGGELSYINPAASEMTRHTTEEILNGGLELIFDRETVRKIKEEYMPETLRKGTGSFEINITDKDGEIRTLAFTSFPAENGNIGAIARDVTDMRALEAALIKAKEVAEQSSRAKSDFLSRMSHEMRTPLHAITGFTSMLKTAKNPEIIEECFQEINNASSHLLGLIEDMLDAISLEEKTIKPEKSGFSLYTLIDNVLKDVQSYIDLKQQTLSHNIDPLIPGAVLGDKKRLAQVIRNLLMNANKFTPERGEIGLDVFMQSEKAGTIVLKIVVKDNGIGIPKEKQETIFSLFEQADGGTSRAYDGAGLGLTISKYIVEMMGGKIWVESQPGKGAKFSFTFKVKTVSRLHKNAETGTDT